MGTTPFVSYDVGATPQDTFVVPYQFWEEEDLDVALDGSAITDFHAPVLPSPAGGEIILGSPVSNGTLTIQRYTDTERYTVFPIAGPFRIESLNNEFNRSLAMIDDRVFVSENNQVTWDEIVNKPDLVVWDDLYPIGSIFITFSESPPTVGTWTKLPNRTFLVSTGDGLSINDTGGEEEVLLLEDNMPAHAHLISEITDTVVSSHNEEFAFNIQRGDEGEDIIFSATNISTANSTTANSVSSSNSPTVASRQHTWNIDHSHTVTIPERNTEAKGGTQPHNNMPPYIAVNMFRRTG